MTCILKKPDGTFWRMGLNPTPATEAQWNQATSRIDEEGRHWRLRRGVWVEIPRQWVGKVPSQRTMRQRQSREHQHRRRGPHQKRHPKAAR